MATRGFIDPEFNPASFVDAELGGPSLIDPELSATTAAAASVDTDVQPVLGTRALALSARRFAVVSVLASALLWNAAVDASGPVGPQPDTYIQPIAGTSEYPQAMAAFTVRSRAASLLSWTVPQDPTILDPTLQEIAGLTSVRASGGRYSARVLTATALVWTAPRDLSGPLSIQPDTYLQPIEGTAALAQGQRSVQMRARAQSALAWYLPADPPILDPYVPDVVGLTAITKTSAAYRSRVAAAASTIWTTAQDQSGPLGPQPDPFVPPVEGTANVGQAMAAVRSRSSQAAYLWTVPADPPILDPHVPAIVGTGALGQTITALRARGAQATIFLWTLPQDVSGPLGPQTDPSIQPIEGQAAIRQAMASLRQRATASAWSSANDAPVLVNIDTAIPPIEGPREFGRRAALWRSAVSASLPLLQTTAQDVSGPLAAQPDTYQPPIEGVRALTVAQGQAKSRAQAAVLGWFSAADSTSASVVDMPPVVIEGTRSLSATSRAYALRVQSSTGLIWTTAQDASGPLGNQPDTYVPPVAGTASLQKGVATTRSRVVSTAALGWTGAPADPPILDPFIQPIDGLASASRAASAWRARVVATAALLQTTAQDSSGPLAIQPDTYVPPIELSAFARKQLPARARAVLAQTLAQTVAADQSGPLALQPDTYVPPVEGVAAVRAAQDAWRTKARQTSLGWTMPLDTSGPLSPQPDTYIAEIPGVETVARRGYGPTGTSRAAVVLGLLGVSGDVPGPSGPLLLRLFGETARGPALLAERLVAPSAQSHTLVIEGVRDEQVES